MATRTEVEREIEAATHFFRHHPEAVPTLISKLQGKPAVEGDVKPDIAARLNEEGEGASLFDKMTSAELMELYQTDRAKWQEVMDSVQSAGERKLAKLQSW
jgi:hypothetical protein